MAAARCSSPKNSLMAFALILLDKVYCKLVAAQPCGKALLLGPEKVVFSLANRNNSPKESHSSYCTPSIIANPLALKLGIFLKVLEGTGASGLTAKCPVKLISSPRFKICPFRQLPKSKCIILLFPTIST